MASKQFNYCPYCTTPLVEKRIAHTQRRACPACNFIYFPDPKLVTVVVVQYNGEFLQGKRNIDPAKGQWSFFSGYVDRGEKVEEAAVREVKEESNLSVQLDQLIGIYSESGNPHVVIAYRASILNNDISPLTADPDEVSELAFFTPDKIPPLAFPTDQQILHDLHSIQSP
ncbi:MAG TPA: NUDIX domain-containing protein [Ktedonobacteraceae bacterium]|nr:NUDIX domain-containing protein [Ktedonobacteraceae bacterium]